MTIEKIAQVAHEVNKAYCESIGDTSQPSWADAPEWQKSSAITGVKFHLENPDASPSASHESWLKQKTEEGWKYGPVKNPETKEHPCFVPYDELPVSQKSKDYLFKQIIHSLAPSVDRVQSEQQHPGPELKRDLSFGEKLVDLEFNPSGDERVTKAKQLCAELADLLNNNFDNEQGQRALLQLIFDDAIGQILSAQMMSVKMLTFKY